MLLSFSVENYLSFHTKQKLTLWDYYNRAEIFNENILEAIPEKNSNKKKYVMNAAAIYGANAAGKSNLFKAIQTLTKITKSSFKDYDGTDDPLNEIDNFKLRQKGTISPYATFNIEFVEEWNNKEYFFEYELVSSKEYVQKEILNAYEIKKTTLGKEINLIKRIDDALYNVNNALDRLAVDFSFQNIETKSLLSLFVFDINKKFYSELMETDEYALLKSACKYLTEKIVFSSNISKNAVAKKINDDKEFREKVLLMLQEVDISISDFEIRDVTTTILNNIKSNNEDTELPESFLTHIKSEGIFDFSTIHQIENSDHKLKFENESAGTKKFVSEFININDCLENGKVYIIDEIEHHYHPYIQKKILELFLKNDEESMPQILFTTHNLDFLDSNSLWKNQIWFVEKGIGNQSSFLYSLADLKSLSVSKENHNWRSNYLDGKFGAVPRVIF